MIFLFFLVSSICFWIVFMEKLLFVSMCVIENSKIKIKSLIFVYFLSLYHTSPLFKYKCCKFWLLGSLFSDSHVASFFAQNQEWSDRLWHRQVSPPHIDRTIYVGQLFSTIFRTLRVSKSKSSPECCAYKYRHYYLLPFRSPIQRECSLKRQQFLIEKSAFCI